MGRWVHWPAVDSMWTQLGWYTFGLHCLHWIAWNAPLWFGGRLVPLGDSGGVNCFLGSLLIWLDVSFVWICLMCLDVKMYLQLELNCT